MHVQDFVRRYYLNGGRTVTVRGQKSVLFHPDGTKAGEATQMLGQMPPPSQIERFIDFYLAPTIKQYDAMMGNAPE
jgi:hypothetical protein